MNLSIHVLSVESRNLWAKVIHAQFYNSQIFRKSEISRYTVKLLL
jgi:hypothetical protein